MSTQGFQQVQKQSQKQVIGAQLQNSLKILQVPAIELRTSILQELQTNPLLEELSANGSSIEEYKETVNASESSQGEEMNFDPNDFSAMDRISDDMREHYALENTGQSYTAEDAKSREHLINSFTADVSLQQHLIEQVNLADCSEIEYQALVYLIGNLDERGFLTETIPSIAENSQIPPETIEKAIDILKGFDPPGVGAKDLQDCLGTQLELGGFEDSLAAKIVREHFDLLLHRQIPKLAKKLGVPAERVQEALKKITVLDPAPGRRFSSDSNTVIEADVTVYKDEYGKWKIELNNEYIPRLRISSTYKNLLAKGTLSKKEQSFVAEKMRSGKFLISSIEQRQQTIRRITEEILKLQGEFFEHGVKKLRPMKMSHLARLLDVHDTTIGRATANKYIRTPHGLFAFKFFFAAGYALDDRESLSSNAIKNTLKEIIAEEKPEKPYSDQAIVKIFDGKNIKIARRTVAKYREELGIPPTHQRRIF